MDTAASSKTKRSDEPGAPNADGGGGDDCIIGLDVGGQLFYTHMSTLTSGSSYFAARFGGSFSAGPSYEDERGRMVYFVDANGKLFGYVLDYLQHGILSWPKDDPDLLEQLKVLAEYYCVDAMVEAIQGSASIAPNDVGKGILYWLGSGKSTSCYAKYVNPFDAGKIEVGPLPDGDYIELYGGLNCLNRRSDFFQYRPRCKSSLRNERDRMLFCPFKEGKSRTFSFVDVVVQPTHYSLRYGTCYGMSDWNFEASVDGDNWDVLHKARKQKALLKPTKEELLDLVSEDDRGIRETEEFVSIAEESRLRESWPVNALAFYKYFRFVSLTTEEFKEVYGTEVIVDEDGRADRSENEDGRCNYSTCLHGVGFELYGDVKPSSN